jgi:hypothetical protein
VAALRFLQANRPAVVPIADTSPTADSTRTPLRALQVNEPSPSRFREKIMDPNATLSRLLDALTDGDLPAAAEHYNNLTNWIARGGFPPSDPRSSATRPS